MAKKISIDMTGKPDELLAQYGRVIRKQGQVINQLKRAGRESKKQERRTLPFLGRWQTQLTGLIGTYAGLQQGISLVVAEHQRTIERGQAAADTQVRIAKTAASAYMAIPAHLGADKAFDLTAIVDRVQRQTKLSQAELYGAATTVGSTIGSGSAALYEQSVLQAARLARYTGGEGDASLFAQVGTNVSQLLGTDDPRVALGLMTRLGAAVKMTSPTQQAKVFPQALAGITAFEGDVERSAELFAAISTVVGDPEGRKTMVAAQNIAARLRSAPIWKQLGGRGEGATLGLIPEDIAATGTWGMLQALQKQHETLTREERAQVETTLGGDVTGKAFIKNVLSRDAGAMAAIKTAREAIPELTPETMVPIFEERLTELQKIPGQGVAQLRMAGIATKEALQRADKTGGLRAEIRSQIEEAAKALPTTSDLQRRLELMKFDWGPSTTREQVIDTGLGILERLSQPLTEHTPQSWYKTWGPGGMPPAAMLDQLPTHKPTEEEKEFLIAIDGLIEAMKALKGEVADSRRATAKNTAATEKRTNGRAGLPSMTIHGE